MHGLITRRQFYRFGYLFLINNNPGAVLQGIYEKKTGFYFADVYFEANKPKS
jgi:hypothetical protein